MHYTSLIIGKSTNMYIASKGTIFALASAVSLSSAVTIFRVSGPDSLNLARKLTRNDGLMLDHSSTKVSKIYCPYSGKYLDTSVLLFFQSPKSYTGEDVLEIQVTGGYETAKAVSSALISSNLVESAMAGEFTYRSVMNGKMSVLQAEALSRVINARSPLEREVGIRGLAKKRDKLLERWRESLIDIMATVEGIIDFEEDSHIESSEIQGFETQIESVLKEIEGVLSNAESDEEHLGKLSVAIVGPPNAGKSTLMNNLAEEEVSIVSPWAGTTRDVVKHEITLRGMKVKLMDTAGIHRSENPIEKIGIELSRYDKYNKEMLLK